MQDEAFLLLIDEFPLLLQIKHFVFRINAIVHNDLFHFFAEKLRIK